MRYTHLLVTSPLLASAILTWIPPVSQGNAWPRASQRAVRAVRMAHAGATITAVSPGRNIGLPGASMALWKIELSHGVRLDVSADGVLVRRSKPVEDKDLPSLVSNGKAKVAPRGADRIVKLETLGLIKFVAMPAPRTRYVVRVETGTETKRVTLDGVGHVISTAAAPAKKSRKPDPHARTTDAPIPELAAKAVQAMRKVFPDMVFDGVEEVPYVDSTTQTIDMLWYEVEFFLSGVKHEFTATEDGVVIQYRKAIAAADLPKPVASAITKELPGANIASAVVTETRAAPRWVGLARPVVVYDVYPKGQKTAVKLRMDGTVVMEPEWPDWVKKAKRRDVK